MFTLLGTHVGMLFPTSILLLSLGAFCSRDGGKMLVHTGTCTRQEPHVESGVCTAKGGGSIVKWGAGS
jgi:hypothetical protein